MTSSPLSSLEDLVSSYQEYLSIKYPSLQTNWETELFPTLNFLTQACELNALHDNEDLLNDFFKAWQMCFNTVVLWLEANELSFTSTGMGFEENIIKELFKFFK